MRIRVWNKLGESKFYCLYIPKLIKLHLIVSKSITVLILLLSGTGGVIGWKIWENYPSVVCIIIAVVSLIKLASEHLIPSEKSISSLHDIQDFYVGQYKQLDKLWFDLENNVNVTEHDIFKRLNTICEKEKDINRKVNSTILYNPPSIVTKAKQLADNYFTQNYSNG